MVRAEKRIVVTCGVFFFQAEDGIRDLTVTGVQTCALPISSRLAMTNVTARKIRDHGRERPAVGVGRIYNGFLVSYPVVGRGMVIFRDPNGQIGRASGRERV